MQRILPAFVCGVYLILAGCNSGVQWIQVKGTVKFNGAPLEKGMVQFEAKDGKSPSAKGGIIENGIYTAEVPAGEQIVRITSNKVVGQRPMYKDMPDSKMMDITEQLIPKKYNTETTLKATVTAQKNDLDFNLDK